MHVTMHLMTESWSRVADTHEAEDNGTRVGISDSISQSESGGTHILRLEEEAD